VNITYEYRAVFHQSLRVFRVGGSSGNKSIVGAGGGAITGLGIGAVGIGTGADRLGAVGMLGGRVSGALFAAVPAIFS
jgi:hypothetical protein